MFPENVEEFIESINETPEDDVTYEYNGTSFAYDFKIGDFIYHNGAPIILRGDDALLVWVEKCIRTEYQKFAVHKDVEYGVILEPLVGSAHDRVYIENAIKEEIMNGLTRNPYIDSVTNWSYEIDGSLWTISFTVVKADETILDVEVIG